MEKLIKALETIKAECESNRDGGQTFCRNCPLRNPYKDECWLDDGTTPALWNIGVREVLDLSEE